MKAHHHGVTLALFVTVAWGCGGGSSPAPRPVSEADKAAIEASPDVLLENAATQLSDVIIVGDVAGIEQMWLTPDQLDGCSITGKEVAAGQMTAFPEKQLQRLRNKASNFGEGARLLHVNTWTEPDPNYLGGELSGDTCKARAFGRANVIVKPKGEGSTVIEHRFNAQLIGDTWYLYRYLPFKADCAKDKNKKELGCRKLAESP